MLTQYLFLQLQKYPRSNHEGSMNGIAVSSFKLGDFGFGRTYNTNQSPLASFRGRPTGRFLLLPDSTGRADLLILQLVTVPAGRDGKKDFIVRSVMTFQEHVY